MRRSSHSKTIFMDFPLLFSDAYLGKITKAEADELAAVTLTRAPQGAPAILNAPLAARPAAPRVMPATNRVLQPPHIDYNGSAEEDWPI